MIILGLDTSCGGASCALLLNGEVHEKKIRAGKKKHSETLMPMIDGLMKEKDVDISDVDMFAVGSGPGSFTGLRIGMAAVKGLAYSLDKKIACVSSLDILANYFDESDNVICPVIDARNNQVYTALYRWNGSYYFPETEYMGLKIEELAGILKKTKRIIEFCGDASLEHYEYFKETKGIKCKEPDENKLYPSAGILVKIAAEYDGLVEITEPEKAVPFYLRVSQAERLYGKSKT